jgi:hypothetical protein
VGGKKKKKKIATEEPYVFWENDIFHVHGDLRKSLRDRATADYAGSWGAHRTQGSITRLSSPKRVLSLIKLVNQGRTPSHLLLESHHPPGLNLRQDAVPRREGSRRDRAQTEADVDMHLLQGDHRLQQPGSTS